MKTSVWKAAIVGATFFFFVHDAFAQAVQSINDNAACVKDEKEPSRKICADKSAQSYLKENFSIEFQTSETLSGVVCDWNAPITKGAGNKVFGIVCRGPNDLHKIVVGWTSVDQKNVDTLQKIGVGQVDFYNTVAKAKVVEGRLFCVDQAEYLVIKSATAAGRCEMVLPSGEKLYSATVFIQPSNVKFRRFFVTVMNITKPTSPDEVKKELLALAK